MKHLTLFTILFSFLANSLAQDEATTFDPENKKYTLNASEAAQVGIVCAEGSIKNVELYKVADTSYYIEIQYLNNNKLYKTRKSINQAQLNLLRAAYINNKVAENTISIIPDSADAYEGRGLMMASCLYTGLTIYSGSVVAIFEPSTAQAAVGLYMLSAGSSFFIPWLSTNNQPVSYGQANLVNYGLTRGYLNGVLLSATLNFKPSNKSVLAFGTITGLTQSYIGFQAVKFLKISNGTANFMTVLGDFGLYSGYGLSTIYGNSSNENLMSTSILIGGLAGYWGAYHIGKTANISTGDAEVISTTGLLGGFLPLVFSNMLNANNINQYITPSVLGGLAGVYVGYKLTQTTNLSFSHGLITKIGTIAGGLMGLGATYMIVPNGEAWHYLAGTYIGAQLGFYSLFSYYKNLNKTSKLSNINFNISPHNYFIGKQLQAKPYQLAAFPLATLTYKF